MNLKQQFLRSAALHVTEFGDALLAATVPLIAEQIKVHGSLPATGSPEYAEFWRSIRGAIWTWAQRFNLDVDWIIDEAWGIIILAIQYSEKKIELIEAFGSWVRRFEPSPNLVPFLLPEWDPQVETPEKYTVRANASWEKARHNYMKEKEREMKDAGYRKVPRSRQRTHSEERRYEWAVKHQCAGISIEKLAANAAEDTEVIRTAVNRILRQLGLTRQHKKT